MCNTLNAQDAQSCKYCGYIFEDFSNTGMSNTTPQWPQPSSNFASTSQADAISNQPTVSTGSSLFVVSRSMLSSLAPGIVYLIFVGVFSAASGFSIYSLGVIVFFILVAAVPVLFTPRKYDFYDGSLHITKIIGGTSEIPYSDLEIHDYPMKRRPRIILSVAGQRRSIVIPGNPTSAELGEDLNHFLHKKLKKYDPNPKSQPTPSNSEANTDDKTSQA